MKKKTRVVKGKKIMPFVRVEKKVGRNELCPCKSGLKFKSCCIDKPKVGNYVKK